MEYVFSYITAMVILLHSASTSDIIVVFKHSDNFFNKKFVEKVLTPRKPINRTTSLTSMDVYLKPGVVLDSPLYMHIVTYKKFATQYKPILVNYKIEMCEAFESKTHPLYILFTSIANATQTNLLDRCPMKRHMFMKPYYTSYKHLPPLLPTGLWRINISVSKVINGTDEKVFGVINYYEITSTGLVEF